MIISVDIHRELTDSVSELEYFLSVKNIEISLYAQARQSQPSTFNPRQYLQSLEIPKQISCVLRGIKRAIPRKLAKISDCRVYSSRLQGICLFPSFLSSIVPGRSRETSTVSWYENPLLAGFFSFFFLNTRQ